MGEPRKKTQTTGLVSSQPPPCCVFASRENGKICGSHLLIMKHSRLNLVGKFCEPNIFLPYLLIS